MLFTEVPSTHLLYTESYTVKTELNIIIPKIYPLISWFLGNLSSVPLKGLLIEKFTFESCAKH